MAEKNIQEQMEELLVQKIERAKTAKEGDEEKKCLDNLLPIYKTYVEEKKAILDHQDKVAQRKDDACHRMYEVSIKEEQVKNQKIDTLVNVGLQVGLTVGSWICYDIWQRRGFKFETTGTVTSPFLRNLIGRMLPKK